MQRRKRFGEILVDAKVISEADLARALALQPGSGQRLGELLEDMGVVTEQHIAATIARQFDFKTVANIAQTRISSEVLALVGPEAAISKQIFPLKQDGRQLYLAMVNPLDIETLDNLAFTSRLRVVPCITTPSEIVAAVNRHYFLKAVDVAHQPERGWTILIVEDQELVRSAIKATLRREGYELLEAENGIIGLMIAVQHLPNLIISDIVMPRMDGVQMFRLLKSKRQTRAIPVIALSSKAGAEEEARLLGLGYSDFIAKPINPVRLAARVKHTLRRVYGKKFLSG